VFTVTRPNLIFASDPINFYTEFRQPFLLFNQQQCLIYSTASFLSKLRAKKVEKLRNSHKTASKEMMAYRKFWKWIIGFRNRERLFPVLPIAKKKNIYIYADRLTLDFFWHVTVNTHIFFFLALVRKDMDVGQHERLSNITLRLKLQQRNHAFIAVQHFKATVGSSTMNLIVP
jgi:hypothetical protein